MKKKNNDDIFNTCFRCKGRIEWKKLFIKGERGKLIFVGIKKICPKCDLKQKTI